MLGKRKENDFLAEEKILSMAKKSFSIHFTSKYKNFVRTKNVLSRQMDGALSTFELMNTTTCLLDTLE